MGFAQSTSDENFSDSSWGDLGFEASEAVVEESDFLFKIKKLLISYMLIMKKHGRIHKFTYKNTKLFLISSLQLKQSKLLDILLKTGLTMSILHISKKR